MIDDNIVSPTLAFVTASNPVFDRIIRRFERDIFPWFGGRPIAEVSAPELLAVVRRIENRGALETAHRASGRCFAMPWRPGGQCPSGDLRGALPLVKGEHFGATTEPKRAAGLLRAMDSYEGTLTVPCALRLAPLVFARPGELGTGSPRPDRPTLANLA
jgi:integrase